MKIIKSIDDQFFPVMEEFIITEVNRLRVKNIPIGEIQIFIPRYLHRMYAEWQYKYRHHYPTDGFELTKIQGVSVLDNYDNTIVVSFQNIHLYHERFQPKILPVFGNDCGD